MIKKDKTVVTTQTDPQIQEEISSWTDSVAVASGYGFTLGLKSDGTVVSSGYSLNGQRDTESWENIVYPKEWDDEFENS